MVTFKQLILGTDFSKVWECLERHYEFRNEASIDKYEDLYKRLVTLTPAENSTNMLVNCGFEKWLSFYIDETTLVNLSNPNIIAHCLVKMAFFGFKQKLYKEGNLIVD